jgi:Fur family ferric uptake transcriptional regulator
MRRSRGASETAGTLHDEIEGRLRRRGLRYTDGRRAIVELLIASDHPVHIGEIAKALPEMPRSSAYRHLADLQAAAVVRDLPAGDDYARFELVEDLTEHHHHLLCTSCGRVIDVPASAELETALRTHLDGLARQAGFRPEHHRVDVFGRCDRCS